MTADGKEMYDHKNATVYQSHVTEKAKLYEDKLLETDMSSSH
jgi:hypothetical protein